MTNETYEQAKYLKEKIQHLNIKKTQVELMKKRDNDNEFEIARELAHDAICFAISRFEDDFKQL